ncbi:MAG: DUF302 domain-containing protein [Candidatus Deferrimicrobiaceae bacterium]
MRRMPIYLLLLALCAVTAASAGEGLVTVKSSYKAKETADRVERLTKERGMTLFNRIDHAEGAKTVGMPLRPTEVLIFGNPKGGTPLMKCTQTAGIDLPLKMLVWEEGNGAVWIGYSDPEVLKDRHGITGCDEVLGKMKGFLGKLASDAAHRDL